MIPMYVPLQIACSMYFLSLARQRVRSADETWKQKTAGARGWQYFGKIHLYYPLFCLLLLWSNQAIILAWSKNPQWFYLWVDHNLILTSVDNKTLESSMKDTVRDDADERGVAFACRVIFASS